MNDWYVIVNKFTGKKIDGGFMHLGRALAKFQNIYQLDATDAEIEEYHNANTSTERRIELIGKWESRCIFKLMTREEYMEGVNAR